MIILAAALLLSAGTPDYCYNEWLEDGAGDGCDIIGDVPLGGGPDPLNPIVTTPGSPPPPPPPTEG